MTGNFKNNKKVCDVEWDGIKTLIQNGNPNVNDYVMTKVNEGC